MPGVIGMCSHNSFFNNVVPEHQSDSGDNDNDYDLQSDESVSYYYFF